MEYKYTQNPTAKVPIILIDQYIGTNADGVTGVDGGQLSREILALKNAGVNKAEVWINSKGGVWADGVSIVGSMTNSGIDFTTVNMGFADSTAGHIFQAGNKRVWMDYSLGLIHEVQGFGSKAVLEAMNASVATMLCGKTKKTADEVRHLMTENTMMSAKMAENYGFCDEVRKGNDILKFTNSSDPYEIMAAGQKEIKKLLPKNKSMKEINELLGLTNEASEAAQLTAINSIIKATNEATAALAAKDTELANAKETLTATTTKLATAEASILEATNAAKTTKAEALVKEHTGKRISNDPAVIANWTKQAVADYDATKALIESINLNVTAPKPNAVAKPGTGNVCISAAQYSSLD